MPRASIVIPCFNCETFIRETVKSALAQTVRDFELICVDNNSTDTTPQILSELASSDSRIQVISETEPGEGPARDAGLNVSTGEWLYFLDSDDLMKPHLLERAINRGVNADADLVIFRTRYLDNQTGEQRPCPECFETSWIDVWEEPGVFAPRNNPARIFNSFQNWVHNKLYRANFIRNNNIHFQHIHRMADILFTCRALAESRRVALLDKELHLYRTNNPRSALFTADDHPLDFYEAFLALKHQLETSETFNLYHDSFVNWAEEAVAMNLYRSSSFDAFSTILSEMKQTGLEKLGIADFPQDSAYQPLRHDCCMAIKDHSPAEVAFYYFVLERRHMNQLETEISRIKTSTTHRVGHAITKPLVAVRNAITPRQRVER